MTSNTAASSATFATARSIMTSFPSSLAAYVNRRRPAKTDKIGFLDLPDEVRKHIYELAIYDHDRGVVFLPRALPRKVTPYTDPNVQYVHEDPQEPMHRIVLVEATIDDGSLAIGQWTNCGSLEEDYVSDSSVSGIETDSEAADSDGGYARVELDRELDSDDGEQISCEDCLALAFELDAEDCLPDCSCDCHDEDSCSQITEKHSILSGEVEIYVQPPAACLDGSCSEEECEHCAGFGLGPSQNELAYINEPEVDEEHQRADQNQEDDAEHFDTEEEVGMLYECTEPPILLACTELRRECLPIYYSTNAFSWRFDWQDYVSSLAAFDTWCAVTVGQQAQVISTLSVEGRHTIEEGVEFVANITAGSTTTVPQVRVKCFHETDSVVERIIYCLTHEMRLALGTPGTTALKQPLSTEVVQVLGKLFVKAMHT